LEALDIWISTRDKKFQLQAKKHGNVRWIVIPSILSYPDLREAKNIAGEPSDKAYQMWCKRELGANSHSLRYAWIRRAMEKGVPADQIALALGHKRLDTTFEYQKSFNSLKVVEEVFGE